jgi:TonB family protein
MRPFLRNLVWVTAVHVAVLVGLIIASCFSGCARHTAEMFVPVDFVIEAPDDGPAGPQTAPPEEDEEEVKLPSDQPPRQAAKEPREIKVSRTKVSRTRDSAKPRTAKLSREEFERLLAKGARVGDYTSIPSDEQWGFETIRRTMYGAWLQPSTAEAGDAAVDVELRLAPDGTVLSSRIVKRAGRPAMDDSVEKAVRLVRRIEGLPQGFAERHEVVTVCFRLEA